MKGKTKTPYEVLVGTRNGYPIYRTVWAYKGHFYVQWNGTYYNVDKDMNERNFIRKE